MTLPLTVLHVDDNPDFLEVASTLFSTDASFETLMAPTAEEGLRLLESREIDCIVSDFVVSSEGVPFISAARDISSDIPIVLFTGKEWTEVADDAIAANVTEYVQKSGVDEIRAVKQHVENLVSVDVDSAGLSDHERLDFLSALNPESSLAVSAAALDEDWTVVAHHDWEDSEELGVTVLEAIEEFTGEDIETFTPLFDSIDADALQAVLAPRQNEGNRYGVQVRFPYRGYELAVTSDGDVAIRPLA